MKKTYLTIAGAMQKYPGTHRTTWNRAMGSGKITKLRRSGKTMMDADEVDKFMKSRPAAPQKITPEVKSEVKPKVNNSYNSGAALKKQVTMLAKEVKDRRNTIAEYENSFIELFANLELFGETLLSGLKHPNLSWKENPALHLGDIASAVIKQVNETDKIFDDKRLLELAVEKQEINCLLFPGITPPQGTTLDPIAAIKVMLRDNDNLKAKVKLLETANVILATPEDEEEEEEERTCPKCGKKFKELYVHAFNGGKTHLELCQGCMSDYIYEDGLRMGAAAVNSHIDQLDTKLVERNLKIMALANELKLYKDGVLNQFKAQWGNKA